MRYMKRFCALALALAVLLSLAGCNEDEQHRRQLVAMDSACELTAYGEDGEAALDAAEGVINALALAFDPEQENSAVWQINHASGAGASVVGQVAELLDTALTVYERSDGALDPTVYPLVRAWGMLDAQFRVPSENEIESLIQNVGYDAVSFSSMSDTDSVFVTIPAGTELTFAALAGGCAAKYAAEAMRNAGAESGIITLGSSVQTLGLRPDGTEWNVAVQDPGNTGENVGVVSVGADMAISTSGGYQRYFVDSTGHTYTHLIDPETGYPANTDLQSVTVVCSDGTMADALATALCIMGETAAKRCYRAYDDFEMILVTEDGRVVVSGGLSDTFTVSGDRSVEITRR